MNPEEQLYWFNLANEVTEKVAAHQKSKFKSKLAKCCPCLPLSRGSAANGNSEDLVKLMAEVAELRREMKTLKSQPAQQQM